MNKKLFSGLALMSVAATAFWACGEGNINGKEINDEIILNNTDEDMYALRDDAKADCKITPDCYLKYQGYLEGTEEVPTSSNSSVSSSAATPVSSAGNGTFDPNKLSSSVPVITSRSSSSEEISGPNPVSSSSSVEAASGLGKCSATVNGADVSSVQKNQAFQWKFTPTSAIVFSTKKGTLTWTYGDQAVVTGTAVDKVSASVSYAVAETYTATVTALLDGKSEDITCTIKVTGIPITGCVCTATAEKADISSGGLATWSIAGCTPATETFTYTWPAGFTGDGANGSFTFTDKGLSQAPVVNVKTAESDVDVTCPAVKSYDSQNVNESIAWENGKTLSEAGTYTLTGCGDASASGQKNVQLDGGSSDDCVEWLSTEWSGNNHWGTCNGQATVTFPLTFELPEGASIKMGNCW